MKRLTTYTDKSYMPLWQEDLDFIQDNLIEVLTQLGKTFAYGRSTYIVSGCVLTEDATKYYITEGLIMYAGELLYCPAQAVNKMTDFIPVLQRKAATDPDGDKLFKLENGGNETRSTWDVNYAELAMFDASIAIGSRLNLLTATSLSAYIESQIMSDSGWVNMTLESGYDENNNVSRRKWGKMVSLRGSFDTETTSYGLVCSIPASWAPLQEITIVTADYNLHIKTTGAIYCTPVSESITAYFDNINWII